MRKLHRAFYLDILQLENFEKNTNHPPFSLNSALKTHKAGRQEFGSTLGAIIGISFL
jgi:hypothetical protein